MRVFIVLFGMARLGFELDKEAERLLRYALDVVNYRFGVSDENEAFEIILSKFLDEYGWFSDTDDLTTALNVAKSRFNVRDDLEAFKTVLFMFLWEYAPSLRPVFEHPD
ncbi:hypothetical protein SBFV2_gp16 [Sulfolobales Beppu filamentous virus 2]|uniref:Uncharacterized protein n=1 Tax=Sulfolobales Beppu filamentous virus 2 TaxID=2493123 RepID=A0A3S8NEU8_9VIRU|nr:hypothetical protein HOU84_gp16 [Sulfolobales Beppu filamentous virus 2]AZI75783.1 hypothetical protein SBFV2_gp16 [Sulfolobales Beppu filamentous virus 2]